MPRETTPEDIAKAYFDGWKLGLKALAIYRDGSKESQPLATSSEGQRAAAAAAAVNKPRRERLPDTRQSVTHKFSVAGHEGYITVGLYPGKPGELGRPGELFITMAKEGSTIGGLMDAFGTAVSMSLQYGVPLEDYVRKFSHMRFEPQGYTKNPDIRIAKSLIDYIFRWLGMTFLPGYKEASMGVLPAAEPSSGAPSEEAASKPIPISDESLVMSAYPKESKSRPPAADKSGPKVEGGKRKGDSGATATLVPSPQPPAQNGHANGNGHSANGDISAALLTRAGVLLKDAGPNTARSEQFAEFQTDAPACDNCGYITVRAGNCYLCHNCGSSMGCS
jgi:ribonucleoside-diphosphate reductase alpha chain